MISTPVTVTDVTGSESNYTLDTHGFAFHRHVSREKGFHDDVALRKDYYSECEKLIKSVFVSLPKCPELVYLMTVGIVALAHPVWLPLTTKSVVVHHTGTN